MKPLKPQGMMMGICRRCQELYDDCQCEERYRRMRKLKRQQAAFMARKAVNRCR